MKDKVRDMKQGPKEFTRRMYAILDRFLKQYPGERVTVRQLFYRLVGSGEMDPAPCPLKDKEGHPLKPRQYPPPGPFANTKYRYDFLIRQAGDARELGEVDWDRFVDLLKKPIFTPGWDSPQELLQAAVEQYHRNRQEGQPLLIELWAEKNALKGLLEPIAEQFSITCLNSMGQFSKTVLREAVDRFEEDGRPVLILYVGDWDPSGKESIEGNIVKKLRMYSHQRLNPEVRRIAITKDQALKRKLPPAMAKEKDTSTKRFIEKHGKEAWEVEALSPTDLRKIIESAIKDAMDNEVYQSALDREAEDIARLTAMIKRMGR